MGRAVEVGFGVGRREDSRRSLLVVQGAVTEYRIDDDWSNSSL